MPTQRPRRASTLPISEKTRKVRRAGRSTASVPVASPVSGAAVRVRFEKVWSVKS